MTAVVIPTYNESENAAAIAAAVLSEIGPGDRLLFVDDGSPDGTGDILDAVSCGDGRLEVMHRKGKEGLGRAYVAGFERALEMGADSIVQMDADFSHDPKDIKRLLEADCDLAIGSRYVSGGRTVGWPFSRKLISRFGGVVVRTVTSMPIKDPTGGFKCWRRGVLERIGLSNVASKGYSFQLEMNHRAWKAGFTIKEIPITFTERRAGTSKITPGIAAESLKMVFALRFGK